MSHNWCPPSRRGHSWRELRGEDTGVLTAGVDRHATRICRRCHRLGRVSNQGVIAPLEIPRSPA